MAAPTAGMNGNAIVDAVFARLGMNVPSADSSTTPSRGQVLEFVNRVAQEMARELGDLMPELWKTVTTTSGVTDLADCAKVLAVQMSDANGANADFHTLGEYYSEKKLNRTDKAKWSFSASGGAGLKQSILCSTGAALVVHYVQYPGVYTDAAAAASPPIPIPWENELIRRATIEGLIATDKAEILQVLLAKRGS